MTASPASSAPDPLTTLASGWRFVDFTIPANATIRFEIDAFYNSTRPSTAGYAIYSSENEPFMVGSVVTYDQTTTIWSQDMHPLPKKLTLSNPGGGHGGLTSTVSGFDAGNYRILLFVTHGMSATFSLSGATGPVTEGKSGEGAVFTTTTEFDGEWAAVGTSTARAYSSAHATKTIPSDHGLVGFFFPGSYLVSGLPERDLAMDTPTGHADCPCFFVDPRIATHAPGLHTFSAQGTEVRVGSTGDELLAIDADFSR